MGVGAVDGLLEATPIWLYQAPVGFVMYLTQCTRYDTRYVVNQIPERAANKRGLLCPQINMHSCILRDTPTCPLRLYRFSSGGYVL